VVPAAGPVRLVASDLDGTLLRSDGTVSPRAVEALARVQAAGVVVVLVTARSWRSVELIAEASGVSGLAICSNGAVVYDLAGRRVHRAVAAEVAALRSFVSRCRAVVPDACFAWETATAVYRTPA
jgi:HAD superfamily hydrolase (TIGR01484 family)